MDLSRLRDLSASMMVGSVREPALGGHDSKALMAARTGWDSRQGPCSGRQEEGTLPNKYIVDLK